jgi:ABC-type antimicrobial peptide transport system permease subunit
MNLSRTTRLALRSLWRNPLRSLLMMIGVAVGIAALTTVTSIGEATRQQTLSEFKNMVGTFDVVNISPGGGRTRGMPSLTTVEPTLKFSDATAIAAEVPGVVQVAEVQNAFDIDVKHRDQVTASAMYGVAANWLEMHSYFVAEGNIFSPQDISSLARVAVIGPDVKQALFPGQPALGKQIRIGNVPFQVKAVLESRGAGPGGSSLDNIVFIPVTTASKRLFNRDYLTTITVQLADPERSDPVVADIRRLLRERHGIVPPGEDDFTISNPRAAALQVSNVSSTLNRVMLGSAAVATFIGGIVIMGLMLVAVAERRREIGMRRAVGATQTDVMQQFLIEAAMISALGGIVGVLLGIGAAVFMALQRSLPLVLLWPAIAGALGLAVLIGLLFGLQPAWKAARMDPIDALRG